MFKNKNLKKEILKKMFVEVDESEEIQTEFNDDKNIYKDAEHIEEVETDENENNKTKK